jgi:hypothetical protein
LYSYFLNTVQTTRNISAFNSGSAADVEVNRIIGTWAQTAPSTAGVLKSSSISAGLTDVVFSMGDDSDQLAANCPGVTRLIAPTYAQYFFPINVVQHSVNSNGMDNTVIMPQNVTSVVNLYGNVQVSATSNNPVRGSLQLVTDTLSGCPFGQKRRVITVREDFVNAFDPTLIVGLRNASAIVIPAGSSCFGLSVASVVPPASCPNAVCTTTVTLTTRCSLTPADGNGLNLCTYQTAASKLSDLGSVNGVYPSNLNFNFNFNQFPYSWSSAFASNPMLDFNAKPVGQDPTGASPDQVTVTINVNTPPDIRLNSSFTIRGGLLPTSSSNITSVLVLSSSGNNSSQLVDLRNTQLRNVRSFILVAFLPSAQLRQTFLLTLDLPSLVIRPLNPLGMVFGTATLLWADIRAFVSASPRGQVCSTCFLLPVVAGSIGMDGFQIEVAILNRLMPANGYLATVNAFISLPPINGTLVGQTRTGAITDAPASRRLLSDDNEVLQMQQLEFRFLADYNVTLTYPEQINTRNAVQNALGAVIGTTTAIGTSVAAVTWLALSKQVISNSLLSYA